MSASLRTYPHFSPRFAAAEPAAAGDSSARERLRFSGKEVLYSLGYLLCLSMIGLNFPLGYLLVPIYMLNAFKKDRYHFLIMVSLLLGGYNLCDSTDLLHRNDAVTFLIGFISMAVLRKTPIVKKTMIAFFAYAAALFAIAMQSDESFAIQWNGMRNYLLIVYIFFPIALFSGREFDIRIFFRRIYLYAFIIAVFYIIDSVILGGAMLLPRDLSLLSYDIRPTFYSWYMDPINNAFLRRWPLGLYLFALCVFPLMRYYRVPWWQLAVVVVALMICRTFTFSLALITGMVFSIKKRKNFYKVFGVGIIAVTVLYFVDGSMGEWYTMDDQGEHKIKHTTLRIKSQIDQVLMLDFAKADEEDLAMLGTGRGAQILPKLELLLRLDKQWTGLGFLNKELTKNKKYIIDNQLYGNPDIADEVAIGVESAPFDVFITIGFIGLIVHALIWVWLWLLIRKLKYSAYFVVTTIIFAMLGLGAVSLYSRYTLIPVSISYAAVILANKRNLSGFSLPEEEQEKISAPENT